MVRKERLELSQVTPLEPKSSASTNSATFAFNLREHLKVADYTDLSNPGERSFVVNHTNARKNFSNATLPRFEICQKYHISAPYVSER